MGLEKYTRSFIGFMESNKDGEWCESDSAESVIYNLTKKIERLHDTLLRKDQIIENLYEQYDDLTLEFEDEQKIVKTFQELLYEANIVNSKNRKKHKFLKAKYMVLIALDLFFIASITCFLAFG